MPHRASTRGRFSRHTHAGQSELTTDVDHQPPNHRMQMHMLVSIRMAECETRCRERSELRADLRCELTTHPRTREVIETKPKLVGRKLPPRIHQIRNFRRRQYRRSFDHHEMQSHSQVRQRTCAAHSIGGGVARDHQAGGVQRAGLVRQFDRFVDRLTETKVVRREDNAPHVAIIPSIYTDM